MTTIAKDVAAKFAVAFVAVAMVFTMFAPAASAQESVEDLQALIESLMSQIAELEGDMGGDSMGSMSSSMVCPYTWTRDLSQGSTGADVMKLQQFLNENPDTRVAVSGAGSAGMETQYYGPATAAAVSKMQVMYRADVLTPAGLVNPTGYFGPSSRAKANALCVAAPAMDDDMDEDMGDDMTDEEEMEDEDEGPMTLSGEASLEEFSTDSASDDEIEEGATDAEIAEVTIEFTDGDAEISRIDLALEGTGDEQDPWDVFESISLWIDGDMVAEEAADDEDDYLDENDGSLRFSGLDIFAAEDEEIEIVVAATLQDNLDGVSDGEAWTVEFDALRFFDADGVATTEDTVGDLGDAAGEAFTIQEEGVDDELIAKTSSSDPDATTLPVEDDKKSDWYTVFVFDLDTDDSENDIELNTIVLNVTTDGVTPADAGYDDLVDDAELVIDGVTIDDVTIGGTSASEGTATLTFDVDGDVTIEAGDRVEAELMLRFNSLPVAEEGATVQAAIASLDTTIVDAEGADDLDNSQLSGSATGELHTLRTEGLILTITESDISETESQREVSGSSLDIGTYVFKFDVEAFEEDFFIDEEAAVVTYRVVVDGVDAPAASSTATLSISGADDAATADEKLSEGQSVDFTFTVETDTSVSGSTEVVIDSIAYSAADDNTEELTQTADPEDDWTSEPLILN